MAQIASRASWRSARAAWPASGVAQGNDASSRRPANARMRSSLWGRTAMAGSNFSVLGPIYGQFGGLHGHPDLAAALQLQLGDGRRSDLGHQRRPGGPSVDADPRAVAEQLDARRLRRPDVARRALRPAPVERYGPRVHRDEDVAVGSARRAEPGSRGKGYAARLAPAAEQVEPGQIRDVGAARPRRHLAQRAALGDPSRLQDEELLGER